MTLWEQLDGSIYNAIGVIIGGFLGLLFRHALPVRVTQTVQSAIGLTTLFLAVRIAWQLGDISAGAIPGIVIALIALAIGGGLGEALRLDERLGSIAQRFQPRAGQTGDARFSEGLLAAFLIFCVGPVTILGSIDNGLRGDNQLLIVKTVLDTITAAALASSYGIGVLFSAVPLLAGQGAISLAAGAFSSYIPDAANNPFVLVATSTGGIILIGLGLNLLEVTKLRIAALLPALLIAPTLLWVAQILA
ncbi:MAG: putative rane protein YdfK [Chloroflexota bacterium]|jgi:uncharacterized membrane protein YqgA involved in biofilm formation